MGPLLPWARPKAQVRPSQMGRLADHGSHLWAQGPCARGRPRVDGFGEDDDGHRAVTSVGRTRRVFENTWDMKTNGYNKWDLRYDVIGLWIHVVFDCLILCLGWGATMGGETDQKRDVTSVEGCVFKPEECKSDI